MHSTEPGCRRLLKYRMANRRPPPSRRSSLPRPQVLDSGFLATAPTLFVQLMADGSYVQVHPQGPRGDGRQRDEAARIFAST